MVSVGINLNIGSQVDPEFRQLMASLPSELKAIQGLKELDPFILANDFFESYNVADASIDPNANMSAKSPVNFQSEIFKPQLKYRSYYEIWRRLKDAYGLDEANDCIKSCIVGALYFHDITKTDMPYCFAFDTSFLMTEGRPYGWLPSVAPKRSNSFMAQLIECTMDFSQEHAGAIGIANLLVNLAYYTRKERAQLHEEIQYMMDSYPEVGNDEFSREDLVADSVIHAIRTYLRGLGLDDDLISEFMGCGVMGCEFTPEKAFAMADTVYDKYIQNILQNFVHIMHNTFRIGGDSPFTNMSLFDRETFNTVFADPLYPDYSRVVENYEEVNRLQYIFVEFFYKGSPTNGKNYRFPVVTANIKTNSEGTIQDTEFFDYIMKKNQPRGAFNIHIGEKVATCCRLTSDLSKLKDQIRMDSFGNGGLSIGSHRVVAINLHRIALIAKEEGKRFAEVLNEYMQKAEKLLIVHKQLLKERVDQKFLKFFNIGWQDMNMFFSTFGYTGLIDAYSVHSGKTLEEIAGSDELLDDYVTFASTVIDYMEEYSSDASTRNAELHMAFNVEEIPGENACPKLAKADNFVYKDTEGYVPVEILSNQMIPLYCDLPLMKRLEISGKLMNKVSGGSILHINLTEQVTEAAYRDLCKMMVEVYHIPHFAINVGSTTCVNGHTTPGIYEKCPECGGEIDTWTIRVVGFATDTKDWSKERRAEFKRRQFYGASDLTAKNIL